MKIKEILNENQTYLVEQLKFLEKKLNTYQIEVDKIKADIKEARKQVDLFQKVVDFIDTTPNGNGRNNNGA